MTDRAVSARGVYYDLNLSPYVYRTAYGDIFKFSSKKKLEIYTRDVVKELNRLYKVLERNEMIGFLPDDTIQLLVKNVYRSFYRKVEG